MTVKRSRVFVASLSAVTLGLSATASLSRVERSSLPRDPGKESSIHVEAFDLPLSGFLSPETRAVLERNKDLNKELMKICPSFLEKSERDVLAQRLCLEHYHYPALIARLRMRYKVAIEPLVIGGVATEIITPAEGIAIANRRRVLINLHGGGFMYGGRWGGQVESIPIAALGKYKIVSVDYRMAPEHHFPAASEDVVAVYTALLADYRPEDIGIYGCSAGAFVTAQSVAWLVKKGMPVPGAIGMFCAGAFPSSGGDSEHMWKAISGFRNNPMPPKELRYLNDGDHDNPLAFPGVDPQIMARFPDSLLIASTRDFLLSSVLTTHRQLVRLGVTVELHVWEGLEHAFFFEPDLAESREVYDVIVRFFDVHLRDERVSKIVHHASCDQ